MRTSLSVARALHEESAPSAAFSGLLTAALDEEADDEAIARMERALARGAGELHGFVAAWRRLARELAHARATGDARDHDGTIEALLASERRAARDFQRTRKLAETVWRTVRRARPVLWRRAAPLAQRMDEVAADFLETLRDLRWEVMADQAEHDPAPVGPILSAPDDVRRHLAGL